MINCKTDGALVYLIGIMLYKVKKINDMHGDPHLMIYYAECREWCDGIGGWHKSSKNVYFVVNMKMGDVVQRCFSCNKYESEPTPIPAHIVTPNVFPALFVLFTKRENAVRGYIRKNYNGHMVSEMVKLMIEYVDKYKFKPCYHVWT